MRWQGFSSPRAAETGGGRPTTGAAPGRMHSATDTVHTCLCGLLPVMSAAEMMWQMLARLSMSAAAFTL